MSSIDLGTAVGLLLSAGGGAFIAAVAKGWSDMRSGARAGQREVVQDLMSWRDDLEDKLRRCEADRDFWRDTAATRGHQIRSLGAAPTIEHPTPPSERNHRRPRRKHGA